MLIRSCLLLGVCVCVSCLCSLWHSTNRLPNGDERAPGHREYNAKFKLQTAAIFTPTSYIRTKRKRCLFITFFILLAGSQLHNNFSPSSFSLFPFATRAPLSPSPEHMPRSAVAHFYLFDRWFLRLQSAKLRVGCLSSETAFLAAKNLAHHKKSKRINTNRVKSKPMCA